MKLTTKQTDKKLRAIHTLLTAAMTSNTPCNESNKLDKAEELLNALRQRMAEDEAHIEKGERP